MCISRLVFEQFLDCPGVVCQSCCLRWCLIVCAMDAAKVEMGEKQGDGVLHVCQLL
jgi:hypothetical protein